MKGTRLRQTKRQKPFILKLALFLAVVWAISGTWLFYSANKNLRNYHLKQANNNVKWLKRMFYRVSKTKELENLIALINNGKPVNGETGSLSTETYKQLGLNYLKNKKDLDGFSKFYKYIESKQVTVPYLKGLYLFNSGQFNEAKPLLQNIKPFSDIYKKGRVPIVENVLYFELNSQQYIATVNGTNFLKKHFQKKRHFLKVYKPAIDLSLQKKVATVLSKFNGSILLEQNNNLLVCFGKNIDVFSHYFEAGSVIKIITASALLTENPSLIKFPYICKKPLNLNGKLFYDWKAHGKLKSIEEALACSCNLMFGEAGVKLGGEIIEEWYKKFFIDNNKKITLEELNFNIGKKEKEFNNTFTLARGSIGVDVPYITPYWLIKTASTIENQGIDSYPQLFSSYKILGITKYTDIKQQKGEQILNKEVVQRIVNGMNLTVKWDKGTGKRANIDGINIYLKTGTAGNKPFNSILLGYFIKNNRTYSFGIFLQKGGKAEYNGAKALKELITIL
jgi:hypothetical protein